MGKKDIRKQLLGCLKDLPKEQLQQKSRWACEKLCATVEFGRASAVMMFLSLPSGEVDTTCAVLTAFERNKTVLVPKVDWDTREMIAVCLPSLTCEMVSDRYGLRYPAMGKAMLIGDIDLVVVPGVGFDSQGNRLGRGGGFYDRFLGCDDFRGLSCGLAVEQQVIEAVPVTEHDVTLNMLVTDRCVRRFEK